MSSPDASLTLPALAEGTSSQRPLSPLIIAGLSVYRESRPCLRSCLDSFCHWVDGVMVLHGPGSEDMQSMDAAGEYDDAMRIVHECAYRFDPQNMKEEYYREHPQRFVLLEMLHHHDEALTHPVTRHERMQTLLQNIQPGNYLFHLKPDEVVVGDLVGALRLVKKSQETDGFQVEVASVHQGGYPSSGLTINRELRIVKAGTDASFDPEGENLLLTSQNVGVLEGIRLYRFVSL